MRKIADSWVTEINYVPDCVVALWEGPQLLLAKVKDADGQDWYIYYSIMCQRRVKGPPWILLSIPITGDYYIGKMRRLTSKTSKLMYTLNRKSLTCFVRTKPRGSVVIGILHTFS